MVLNIIFLNERNLKTEPCAQFSVEFRLNAVNIGKSFFEAKNAGEIY